MYFLVRIAYHAMHLADGSAVVGDGYVVVYAFLPVSGSVDITFAEYASDLQIHRTVGLIPHR